MHKIGSLFAHTATFFYDNPRVSLASLLAVLVMATMQLGSLKPLDVSLEGLLGRDAPENIAYNTYKEVFGSDEVITLLISSEKIIDRNILQKISVLHEDIANRVPQVRQIISLVNTPFVSSNGNHTSVGRAFLPWPADETAVQARLDMLSSGQSPYHRALINAEGNLSLIFIQLGAPPVSDPIGRAAAGTENHVEVIKVIRKIVDAHRQPDFGIQITGQATILAALRAMLVRDLFLLPIAALLASILALLALFQRRSAVAIPALVIPLPLIGTFSLMAILSYPIQQPTALIPPFIVIISVAGTVHLLTSFYEHYTQGTDKRSAMANAFEEKGTSLLMTTLTTAAALLTFSSAELSPIANFGLFGTCGTLLTLISTLIVLPLYVRLTGIRPLPAGESQVGGILRGRISQLIETSSDIVSAHSGKILIAAILMMIASALIATNLRFTHNLLNWLPAQWPELKSAMLADQQFHSGVSVEILIDSGSAGGVVNPAFIHRVNALANSIRTIRLDATPIGLILSIDDYLQPMRTNFTIHERLYTQDNAGMRQLARDIRLLRLTAPELLASVTSPDLRYTRISIRTHTADAAAYSPLLDTAQMNAKQIFGDAYDVRITGQVSILARTLDALVNSAKNSYLMSLGVIMMMMALLLRSARDGFWSLLPNILPISLVLAGMWLLDINLDLFTMLVVSVAMGLVVDDTIHFMTHFHRHFASSGDARAASRQALRDTGRAMIISTTVLVTGIQFLYLSELHSVGVFGSLTSAVMILGLAADFVIAPALMIWLYRNHSTPSASGPNEQRRKLTI